MTQVQRLLGLSTTLALVAQVGCTTTTATPGQPAGPDAGTDVWVPPAATPTAVTVSPSQSTLSPGETTQFSATLSWSDGSTSDVTSLGLWTTSDPSIATITASGLATGIKAGQATVSISAYGLVFSTVVTVSEAAARSLSVSPAELVLSVGGSGKLSVGAAMSDGSTRDVTAIAWYQVQNGSIAEVSQGGNVLARSAGTTRVSVQYGSVSADVTVRVSNAALVSLSIAPSALSLNVAESKGLVVTGTFADGTSRDVTGESAFSVSDGAIATVDGKGQVRGLAAGQAVVTATSGGQFATATVTVSAPRIVSLAVAPANSTVVKADEAQFTATATYSNGQTGNVSGSVSWSVADPSVGSIDATGKFTAIAVGATEVSASLGGRTNYTTVTVVAPSVTTVSVSPSSASVLVGSTVQLTAHARMSNGTSREVTRDCQWTSSSAAATVAGGLVSGMAEGATYVTCSLEGRTASSLVTVQAGAPTASCTDGIKNGLEADIDCGSACSAKCAMGKRCGTVADCSASMCNAGVCEGAWGTASLLESDSGHAQAPQVAVDAAGNAVAVWHQFDGTFHNIYANRFTPGGGWGTATLIKSPNEDAFYPQVAADAAGNAIAVWYQLDGSRYNIWANRFTPGGGWGAATLIESDDAGDAYEPQVAMDAAGNAVAVWSHSDGVFISIYANRFTPGSGWGAATLLESSNLDAGSPQVAVDSAGNAVAVWYQDDGTRKSIYANRFTPGGGWGGATLVESNNAEHADAPHVAVDAAGNAIAVWFQDDGVQNNIWANRYTAGGGWGTATLLESGAGHAYYPKVAMDAAGNAVVVWYQYDGNQYSIYANRFTPGGGWGTPTLLESDNAGTAGNPRVAVDAAGNAVAVWSQSDGTRANIYANRFTPGAGWGAATLIEFDNAGTANSPHVAVDAAGNVTVVWYQNDGTRDNIWAKSYR